MDADTIFHLMQSRNLLTDDLIEVIASAPNDMRMNCLLLHCVKKMETLQFLEFCSILKSTDNMQHIGEELETCKSTEVLTV